MTVLVNPLVYVATVKPQTPPAELDKGQAQFFAKSQQRPSLDA